MIREMAPNDSTQILEIYKMGLETRKATFETRVPSWEDWDARHHQHSRFVYLENNQILGWVALAPTSVRQVYKGVAEVSIYIHTNATGKGIGSKLMEKVITSSEENQIWTLQSSVFPENRATLKLHEKFRFRIVGVREKIAQLDNKWKDTLLLERRSKKI